MTDYDAPQTLPSDAVLELDVDVLIPAAVSNVITTENADDIEASLVVEGANGPTTFAADELLEGRGIPVVPDILANMGGVVVSYFEWLQDLNRKSWSLDHVNEELEETTLDAWNDIRRKVESRI